MNSPRRTALGARTEELIGERPNGDRALRLSDLEGVVAEAVLKIAKKAGLGAGGGSSGLVDGTYGSIIISGGGTTMTLVNGTVGLTKLAAIAAETMLGNNTGSAASPIALDVDQIKAMLLIWTTRVSKNYIGSNTRSLLAALKVTAGRFANLWRERDVGNIVPYFTCAAMTLAPDVFSVADRQACVAATIDKLVVAPRQNSATYSSLFTMVIFPSGKIFFNISTGTTGGSAPSDAGATVAGDTVGDTGLTWQYTGEQAPAGWEYFLMDVHTGLAAVLFGDSHDAYAGVLVTATAAANVDATWLGTASAHPGFTRMQILDQIMKSNVEDQLDGTSPGPRLARTFQDGVDETGAPYTVRWFADNAEACAGYRALSKLRAISGLSTAAADQNAADIKAGLLALFVGGRFQTFQGQNPAHLALSGSTDFKNEMRLHIWMALYGLLDTKAEWQAYGDAVFLYTVAAVPEVFTDLFIDTLPMTEWFYVADRYFHESAGMETLRALVTARNIGNITIVDAALLLTQNPVKPDWTDIQNRPNIPGGAAGQAVLDFGNYGTDASVAVTGQTGIIAGSQCFVSLAVVATPENTIGDIVMDPPMVFAGNIVPGVGFTIYGKAIEGGLHGRFNVDWEWR